MGESKMYPETLQAALDLGGDEGWTAKSYQAALTLALAQLCPPDVIAAIEHGVVEGWTDQRYQAALSMVLALLRDADGPPELVLQYTAEGFTYQVPRWVPGVDPTEHGGWGERTEVMFADTTYVVCPVCRQVSEPDYVERCQEVRSTSWKDAADLVVVLSDDGETLADGEEWFRCNRPNCLAQLRAPDWLDIDWQ